MFTRIITALARDLKDDELSVAQVAALHLVDDGGAVRLSALADALGMSPSATSRMADDLVQRGLLTRTEDPDDRRAKLLRTTREGDAFIRKASEGRLRVMAENIGAIIPAPLQEMLFAAMAKGSPSG
jgi:DNA-binding MarR family transcriptional regulator